MPLVSDADDERRTIPTVFIVGSSRSGTTMMSRILGRHPRVHAFNELHFFDELTGVSERSQPLARDGQVSLLSRLLTIERDGFLFQKDPDLYASEARHILPEASGVTPVGLYGRFLGSEVRRNGAEIACEQTPRNVFHLEEIHRVFPRARVVHMVRDPRAVLLSQKNKWKRRFLGRGGGVPLGETLRSWLNYHPVTISKLWKNSVLAADEFAGEDWLLTVRFEDVAREPEQQVRQVCEFTDLEFSSDLLSVPKVGSSNAPDRPDERGIDASRVGSWREGGLSETELWICQKITGAVAQRHGYEQETTALQLAGLLGHGLSFPLKSAGAVLVNIRRFSDLLRSVRRWMR